MPKIAILAGEPSGDMIACHLMADLNKHYKNIQYIGVGGPFMQKYGLESFFDYSHLAVRGYFGVIKKLPLLLRLRGKLIEYLLDQKPDIFIGIDAPDFNFKIERKLKNNNIPVYHYVAPSVWAWRKKRIHEMKKDMNHIFSLFPHEKLIFNKIKLPNTFVGHPLANKIPIKPPIKKARELLKINSQKTIISLLPGSRKSELKWHLDVMIKSAIKINQKINDCEFLIPVNNRENHAYAIKQITHIDIKNIKIIIGHSHDVICASNLCILASGTASLEAALYKKPMIIIYKMSWLSWIILKRMHLIPYVGLPNILLNKFFVPELIQYSAKDKIISAKAIEILSNKEYLKEIRTVFAGLHKQLKKDTSGLIIGRIKRHLK